MRKLACKYCPNYFEAKRIDATRCPDCKKTRSSSWQKSDRGRAMRAASHRKVRMEAYAGYGGMCTCCEESRFEFLCLDHVKGGGNKDRKIRSTYQIARYVIVNNFPKEFTVLCHNCNMAKGFFGQCPHKRTG